MKIKYHACGVVLGELWGGGKGYYPANNYNNYSSLSKLKKDIRRDFKSGGLDSGMGFEELTGAYMMIIIERVKTIDGREFIHKEEIKPVVLGKINKSEAREVTIGYGP